MQNNNSLQTALELQNLTKRYGKLVAVDDLSLKINQGEIFRFLGPNGAGKTTTINIIAGLMKADSGKISFYQNGKSTERKNQIGLCPQDLVIWNKLTCLEQLLFIGDLYGIERKRAKMRSLTLLETLGLGHKKNVLATRLSGGMKRRLNLMMAMVHDPPILILDEPEAGLDPQSRILVREFIKETGKYKTIILTTHNMDEAERISDRIGIIDHGKLLISGTAEELKKTLTDHETVEVVFGNEEEANSDQLMNIVKPVAEKVIAKEHSLLISEKMINLKLSDILNKLQKEGIKVKELKYRTSTLEDVFIHLTGRDLRE